MNRSVVRHLILKDWRLNRLLISVSIAVGLAALAVAQAGSQTVRLLGSVWFFVSLCVLASMLPATAILNERKKKTLAFVMSLPVSSAQYGVAKFLSILAMFLVPWLTLLVSALVLMETRGIVPRGAIPWVIILAMLPLVAFCIISGSALVGESEGWLIGSSLVCNSSYWFVWYLLARIPTLTATWKGPVTVWSPAILETIAAELAIGALVLGLAFFLQSRKRDFI
jgi:ABC-2 type transport system permease protein